MSAGEILVFRYRRGLRVGRLVERDKKKVRLEIERDKTVSVPQENILVATGRTASTPAELQAFERRLAEEASGFNLREVWELVSGEADEVSLEDLEGLVLGDEVDPVKRAALLWKLAEDDLYFELCERGVRPLSRSRVEEGERRRARKEARAEEEERFMAWLEGEAEEAVETWSAERKNWLSRLKAYVIQGEESPHAEWARPFLKRHGRGGSDPRRYVFEKLCARGVFKRDENLSLLRLEVARGFEPAAVEAASAYDPVAAALEPDREDLTALEAFTIDDATTADMDDAVSLEILPEGYRLGIHITDLSTAVPPGSPLDLVARDRVTSLYLPDEKIPMLPDPLTSRTGSLVPGEVRPALSLLAELDRGLEIRTARLVRSRILCRRRLNYDEVDRALEGGEDPRRAVFELLLSLAERLRKARLERGAVLIERPELEIEFDEEGEPIIRTRPQDSPARRLIGELMILYNVEAARFALAKGLAVIYRTQDPLKDADVPPDAPEPLRRYRLLRGIGPSGLALEPSPHHLLGVDCYCQASSPLRRYVDLVIGRQLSTYLRTGRPAQAREEIETALFMSEERARELNRLEFERERYWVIRHLARRTGETFRAVVLEARGREGLIEVLDFGIRTQVLFSSEAAPGDAIDAVLAVADPWEGILRFKA